MFLCFQDLANWILITNRRVKDKKGQDLTYFSKKKVQIY